jgi:hypothetical protein
MPAIASLEALDRAITGFEATDLNVAMEPAALAAAQRSLKESGLLLLGEVHGVRENPLLMRALMDALSVTGLALEWPSELAPVVSGFLGGGPLPDSPLLWGGDGRITVGHLAVLREQVRAGRLTSLTLFDGWRDVGWSLREASMAERVLMAEMPEGGTLVVAGNAHTPLQATSLGLPLGARLAGERPGIREVRIRYGNGGYYNLEPRSFGSRFSLRRQPRLTVGHGELVFDLPTPTEALVPHRLGVTKTGGFRAVT